jgi:hypothetical protein
VTPGSEEYCRDMLVGVSEEMTKAMETDRTEQDRAQHLRYAQALLQKAIDELEAPE